MGIYSELNRKDVLMNIKDEVKKLTPVFLLERKQWLHLKHESLYQLKRFYNAITNGSNNNVNHCIAKVTFYSHQIEKGLSHSNFRYGFGKSALMNLSSALEDLKRCDSDYPECAAYQSAVAALQEYRYKHENAGYHIDDMIALFPSDIWDDASASASANGGSVPVKASLKDGNATIPFENLFLNRRSVREFSDSPLTETEIQHVIEVATKAPSVCNRQPVRVYVITNKSVIEKALKLQGGFNGYKVPPALFLITADNEAFLSISEHNEGFVDGGLFSMALLMAMEANKIAACPLNTMFSKQIDQQTRNLIGVPENEFLIMYIAAGHFPDETHTCISKRYPVQDILTIVR